MTTYSAKSTVGWRGSEIRDLVIAAVIALLCWGLFAGSVFPTFNGLLLGVGIVFTLVFFIGLYFNVTRKRNVTLLAEMNTDGWRVQWWGKKPLKSVWGTRLSPVYNNGSLNEVQTINATKVGVHRVWEFNLPRTKLTLPERLAKTDGVRDFLLAWVEANDGQLRGTNRESVESFVNEVLNRGRDVPGTMTENEAEPAESAVAAAPEQADAATGQPEPWPTIGQPEHR